MQYNLAVTTFLLFASVTSFGGKTAETPGDQSNFRGGFSGYNPGDCDGSMGGPDTNANGKARPSKHTFDNPGGGWVMLAVAPSKWSKLKGCETEYRGKTLKVMDTCPFCEASGRIDVAQECDKMNSLPKEPITLKWKNCGQGVNQKWDEPVREIATKNKGKSAKKRTRSKNKRRK